MKTLPHNLLLHIALLFALGSLAACGSEEESSHDDAEFAEAIPTDEMLALTLDDGAGGGGGLYATQEQALVGQPSRVAEHVHATMERVNQAREATRAVLQGALASTDTHMTDRAGLHCKIWEYDGASNHWELASCQRNRADKRYAFALRGRPLASTDDADYQLAAGGYGVILPQHEGRRRGAGVVGYDFDVINGLTGQGPTGKMAIGFRAAGPYRQVVVGLKDFFPVGGAQAFSALYRYGHLIGRGGLLRFGFEADVLSKDATTGELSETLDTVAERGRITVGWTTGGKARMAGVVCGGSLGAGECVADRECWDAGETITFQDLTPNAAEPPAWDATACPGDAEMLQPVEPPTEAELTPDAAEGGEAPGPALQEPAADPTFEEAAP